MNISYNWLRDIIATELTPTEVASALTRVGMAVEGVHPTGDDFVLDIDLTSNRPDCLSHLGIARELSVAAGTRLNVGSGSGSDQPSGGSSDIVRIEEPGMCRRFSARIINNVTIGPSPDWLVARLEAIGERSINNVADITNYVMHELGHPMHAFDLDKLSGRRIIVRRTRSGETLTTLDEVERKLDASVLAICDAEKPVSVAGIMGGIESGITEATANVLLEVAYFDRGHIRESSRKLKLATEASYRFERGVDIENVLRASERATRLICELAGGTAGQLIDVYPSPPERVEILSPNTAAAVARLTGLKVDQARCDEILSALGIKKTSSPDKYFSPSWRYDLNIEEDLVEEVARHVGYENIASELPPAYGAGEYQPNETRERSLRLDLISTGFNEAVSYSFIDTKYDGLFAVMPGLLEDDSSEPVTLRDAVIEGAVRMRQTQLPGLLEAVRLNFNQKRRDVRIFEIGKVFSSSRSESVLPNEQKAFALVVTGKENWQSRGGAGRDLDLYDLTGAVEAALEAAGIDDVAFLPGEFTHLKRGQSAEIRTRGGLIGSAGRLSDSVSALFKFRQPVFVAELNLGQALSQPAKPIYYSPLPKYPAIERDVSFLISRSTTFAEIREAIVSAGSELCREVIFVDVYEGKGLAPDERSLTVRLVYRSDERTLIEDEVESVHGQIVSRVEQTLNAKVRY